MRDGLPTPGELAGSAALSGGAIGTLCALICGSDDPILWGLASAVCIGGIIFLFFQFAPPPFRRE